MVHRVQKLLSNFGYCSRRRAEEIIDAGRVTVDGAIIKLGDKAEPTDEIRVDGELVSRPPAVYLMLHKPVQCVTARRDRTYPTVMRYVPGGVFPIGRLDYHTSGLLLFTNDGDFANQVMHPSYEVTKVYRVGLDSPLRRHDARLIEQGVQLRDGRSSPARLKRRGSCCVDVYIHEGRNRIVRRIFAATGYRVQSLQRIAIGALHLGRLQSGEYRYLSRHEAWKVFSPCR